MSVSLSKDMSVLSEEIDLENQQEQKTMEFSLIENVSPAKPKRKQAKNACGKSRAKL